MNTVINHKKYAVAKVLNSMSYNFEFEDKDNVIYLVDGYDVQDWCNNEQIEFVGVKSAIAYARYLSNNNEDSSFWWKIN